MANFPTRGFYRHFKGRMYFVLGIEAARVEVDEPVVTYRSETERPTGKHWVTSLRKFNEVVRWPDGQDRPRFVWDEDRNRLASKDPQSDFDLAWRKLQSARAELLRQPKTPEEKEHAVKKLVWLLGQTGAAATALMESTHEQMGGCQ